MTPLENMGSYDLIVVDPPWPMQKLTHRLRPRQVGFDYSVMNLNEIRALPIDKLVNENSLLFLWTTQKFLEPAFEVVRTWRFHYLLTMVWEKTYGRSAGMPLYGFRWNAEFILVGYKSKPSLWPKRPLIPAVFQAENIKHSQKPNIFYQSIAPLGKTRIDVFARQEKDGWTCWGNELPLDNQTQSA